jgi:hypothetical protein
MTRRILISAFREWRLVAAALIAVATVFVGLYVRPAADRATGPAVQGGGAIVLTGPVVTGGTVAASVTEPLQRP